MASIASSADAFCLLHDNGHVLEGAVHAVAGVDGAPEDAMARSRSLSTSCASRSTYTEHKQKYSTGAATGTRDSQFLQGSLKGASSALTVLKGPVTPAPCAERLRGGHARNKTVLSEGTELPPQPRLRGSSAVLAP